MALKQAFMIKNNLLAAATSLSITAKPGESIRVKGLRAGALVARGFLQCFIDRVSVGFWYIGDINANHLEQFSEATILGNLFERLMQKGVFNGYPVGEGQTFELRSYPTGDNIAAAIIYEIGEKDDFKPVDPNGSQAKEFFFLNYGTNGTIIAVNATGTVDTPRNPSEYPAFPFGAVVPAKQNIQIMGFLLMNWKDAFGVVNPNYAYLKLIKDRNTLFDEDKNGICIREGMGFGSWGPNRTCGADVEFFPEPLTFGPGDELLVQLTAGAAPDIDALGSDVVAVMKIKAAE